MSAPLAARQPRGAPNARVREVLDACAALAGTIRAKLRAELRFGRPLPNVSSALAGIETLHSALTRLAGKKEEAPHAD
ncbi:MAG: hypothetical protein V2A73_11165 [Pseudomonadota bacterium]